MRKLKLCLVTFACVVTGLIVSSQSLFAKCEPYGTDLCCPIGEMPQCPEGLFPVKKGECPHVNQTQVDSMYECTDREKAKANQQRSVNAAFEKLHTITHLDHYKVCKPAKKIGRRLSSLQGANPISLAPVSKEAWVNPIRSPLLRSQSLRGRLLNVLYPPIMDSVATTTQRLVSKQNRMIVQDLLKLKTDPGNRFLQRLCIIDQIDRHGVVTCTPVKSARRKEDGVFVYNKGDGPTQILPPRVYSAIVNQDNQLVVAIGDSDLNHYTLGRGNAVKAAIEFTIENKMLSGKQIPVLTQLSNKSGGYQTGSEGSFTRKMITSSIGINPQYANSKDLKVIYYYKKEVGKKDKLGRKELAVTSKELLPVEDD